MAPWLATKPEQQNGRQAVHLVQVKDTKIQIVHEIVHEIVPLIVHKIVNKIFLLSKLRTISPGKDY